MDAPSFTLTPIGYLRSQKLRKAEAPRQSKRSRAGAEPASDFIELNPNQNFEQALSDLDGFSHLWVIFVFHQAKDWKPMIQPPRGSEKKVGVFASRSPYRPSPIGLSLVRLRAVKGRKLEIEASDLLDGTPILDIKPYVAGADEADSPTLGWMEFLNQPPLKISLSAKARKQIEFIDSHKVGFSLLEKIHQQLEYSPFQNTSKRVKKLSATQGLFSHRYWRILFEVKKNSLKILEINHDFDKTNGKISSLAKPETDLYESFRSTYPWTLLKPVQSKN